MSNPPVLWPSDREVKRQKAQSLGASGVVGVGILVAILWLPLAGSMIAAGGLVFLIITRLSAGSIRVDENKITHTRLLRGDVVINLSERFEFSEVDFHGSRIALIRQGRALIEVPINETTRPVLEQVRRRR